MVEGFYPKTILEAVTMKKQHPESVLVLGGTDVGVVKKVADTMIFLNQIKDQKNVEIGDNTLKISAQATYVELLNHELIPTVLKTAMKKIASVAIRNAGTVIGNICNASPAGDTLPVLYAMEAVVVIASLSDTGEVAYRRKAIKDFILGIRKTDIEPSEIVTGIEIPDIEKISSMSYYYQKVGAREAEAISKLSFVSLWNIIDDKVEDVRIAFGSVGITVLRNNEIEEMITDSTRKEVLQKKDAVIHAFSDILHPIDDQRSTAEYRKTVCLNLLGDCLSKIAE